MTQSDIAERDAPDAFRRDYDADEDDGGSFL